jgi:hypothetical protein
MSSVCTWYFVQLWQSWQDIHQQTPTVQQRVLASSEAHAVVQVMKQYHLKAAARVWVSRSAHSAPTSRLVCVIVKGNKRSWKQEVALPHTAQDQRARSALGAATGGRRQCERVPTG